MTGREWTFGEDSELIGAYIDGAGWEERAAERLEGRTPDACERRGGFLHLRSTAWMRREMRRMGMTGGAGADDD
jgi:hypothetical protein